MPTKSKRSAMRICLHLLSLLRYAPVMPLPGEMGLGPVKREEPAPPPQKAGAHATPHAVRCSQCRRVGLVYFEGGWNFKKADRLMNERPVRGDCGYCRRRGIELIPIPHLSESDRKELQHLYNIQDTLEKSQERGWRVDQSSLLLPIEHIDKKQKQAARAAGTPGMEG